MVTSNTPRSGRLDDMRPAPASSASDARLPASTTVRSRVTASGRRSISAETSAVPRPCQSSAIVTAISAVADRRVLQEMGHPGRPLLAPWRQHYKQQRNVMHPVHAAGKLTDHRVIELAERREEPVPARLPRQTTEPLAQRLGIGKQQRPDPRRSAVPQQELPGQHLAARLSRGRAGQNRRAPCRLHTCYIAPSLNAGELKVRAPGSRTAGGVSWPAGGPGGSHW
jgi:hypothetical protein